MAASDESSSDTIAPAGHGTAAVVGIRVLGAVLIVAAMARAVARFGIGEELDAYYWAWVIPQLLAGAVALSVSHVILPGLARTLREDGSELMYDCVRPLFYWVLIVLAGVTLIAFGLVAYSQYALGHSIGLAFDMLPWLLAAVALNGTTQVLGTALRLRRKPLGHAVQPLLAGGGIMLGVALFADGFGVCSIAMGVLIGAGLGLLLMLGLCFADGFRLGAGLFGPPAAKQMLDDLHRPAGTGLGAEGDVIIERLLGSLLGPGYVALLGLAGTIAEAAETVPAGAVTAAVEPSLSSLTASEDHCGVAERLRRALQSMAVLCLPPTILLALAGTAIVGVLFGGQTHWVQLLGWMVSVRLLGTAFRAATRLLAMVPEQTGHLTASAKVIELSAATRAVLISAFAIPYGVLGMAIAATIAAVVSTGIAAVVVTHMGYPLLPGLRKSSTA